MKYAIIALLLLASCKKEETHCWTCAADSRLIVGSETLSRDTTYYDICGKTKEDIKSETQTEVKHLDWNGTSGARIKSTTCVKK